MSENDKDTLAFWLEFEFDNFEQWTPPTPPTTTTTSTMPIHASGGPIWTPTTKSTTTTTLSVTEIHQRFCYSQPLAFCSNCEPMCTIQTNCLIYDICYTNLRGQTKTQGIRKREISISINIVTPGDYTVEYSKK